MIHRRDGALRRFHRTSLSTPLAAVALLVVALVGGVQPAAGVEVQGWYGEDFGVAVVSVPIEGDRVDAATATESFALRVDPNASADGSAWVGYPVFAPSQVGPLLRDLIGPLARGNGNVTVRFLFRGDQPFTATIYSPAPHDVTIVPRKVNPRAFARQVNDWRRAYDAQLELLAEPFPPIAEAYLRNMLPQRFGLAPPARTVEPQPSELERTIDLLAGSERLRVKAVDDAFRRTGDPAPADRPLPPPMEWLPTDWSQAGGPDDLQAVAIEPIAAAVPEECFYVRFGSFQNYLWLEKLVEENGGDLSRMLTLRGQSLGAGSFAQSQLGLRKHELAEWFGSSLIADVAVIGRDLFVQDGAAIGVLFHAKSELLKNEFDKTRKMVRAEQKDQGAKLSDVEIAGHTVSLLETPGGELRSYYAVSGDFHLHASSRAIVERFFQATAGERSLALSPEFRNARRLLPIDRDDTVFGFFSTEFFHGALESDFQVELARRQASRMEMEILTLARLAAANEGIAEPSIETLIADGFLPPGFGVRADGSRLIETEAGPVDSIRGPLGAFTPIPDVPVEAITAEEEAEALDRRAWFASAGHDVQPLSFAMRRYLLSEKPRIERVAFDVNVSPLERERMGWLIGALGEPTNAYVPPVAGDAIHLQASVAGMPGGRVGPHTLFLGVQDVPAKGDLVGAGLLKAFQTIRTAPGYLGSFPRAGWLDLLPRALAPVPQEAGYQRLMFGLYRWQQPEFALVGFDPELLDRVRGELQPGTTEDFAIARLSVIDLSDADVATWVNGLYLDRALTISDGNAKFLHLLSEQFGVPRQEAPAIAEEVLGAKLVDTLEGEYVLSGAETGPGIWRSSKMVEGQDISALKFEAPVMDWFRGLTANLAEREGALWLHAEIDMERKAPAAAELQPFKLPEITLPFWNSKSAAPPAADEAPPQAPSDDATTEELPPPVTLPPLESPRAPGK